MISSVKKYNSILFEIFKYQQFIVNAAATGPSASPSSIWHGWNVLKSALPAWQLLRLLHLIIYIVNSRTINPAPDVMVFSDELLESYRALTLMLA